jgi:menaquinone-dependent protoporphyrinogen oxidase
MKILIVFGTTEGHTRELVHFAAARLREAGHVVTTEEAGRDARFPDPAGFGAIILAGSLHLGRYQPALVDFARAHHEHLNTHPSAFISVSLSAAGVNPDDWEGLRECLARFEHETGWRPSATHQAAGAIRYSQYDFFKRLAIKHIAQQRGQKTTTSRDYDLTDYSALTDFVLAFIRDAETAGQAGA